MDRKLKIAIIGCSRIFWERHRPALAHMENAEIAAVCDTRPERAKAAAEACGTEAYYTDYHDMLKIEGLDAVDICTPNFCHAEAACDALNAGLHVFCEKPDAISAAEAEKMKTAAEKNGRVLMVMRNNRYWPTSEFLKKYISDGKMGDIYAGRCGWIRRRGIPGRGGWFTTKALSGGGALIDLGIHMIDLAVWLMGNPRPVAVSGCTYRKFDEAPDISDSDEAKFGDRNADGIFDVEDLAMGFLRFDNGACLQIEFSWASNIEEEQYFVELRGSKAGSRWSSSDQKLRIFTEENGALIDYLPKIDNGKGIPTHEANLRHFADVVLNGAAADFLPQQGVNEMKILEAVYQSARTGREVLL